ncbi:MAG: hypothetical protein KKF67_00940 [Nanoarchaeota archaeon]|nr:hypothetical protein [Nanoarchaeota archaeon]
MNNQGTDKLISVYWFVILFLVAAGIVYMVIVFYGAPYDIRKIEANIMINQIADCVATGGKLNEKWDSLNNENFLQNCHLTFNVEDTSEWKNDQFYVEVNYSKFDETDGIDLKSELQKIKIGNSLLNDNCGFKGKYIPVCVERRFYVLDEIMQNQYVIKIKSVVGKVEKNVQ